MLNDTIALTELGPGKEALVVSLYGGRGSKERLRALGILEGQRVRKLSSLAAGGPVIILVNRAQVAIGRGMAHKILVQPL